MSENQLEHSTRDAAMSATTFDRPLSLELLQWLARASLRQPDVLSMSIRLWVMLRSLYGGIDDRLYIEDLGDRFNYPEWRNGFFLDTENHNCGDAIPQCHDADCPCHKTITDWLFDPDSGMPQSQWKADFDRHYGLSAAESDRLLNPTDWIYDRARGQTPDQWRANLQNRYQLAISELDKLARTVPHPERERHKNRPFAVSRKSLKKDLNTLVKLGWLAIDPGNNREKYRKVEEFPSLPVSDAQGSAREDNSGLIGEFVQSDLIDCFDYFAQPINNKQRFFLHVEYIIPSKFSNRVNALQTELKHLWSQTPVPPVRLTYESSRHNKKIFTCQVYPVCICYYKRAPYLFAYGQTPYEHGQRESPIGWYDYRLDRIQSLEAIPWQEETLPIELKPWQTTPEQPSNIFDRMNEAMGFEFYQPKREMLVWFDRYFYGNYIEDTERASTFQKLSHEEAMKWAAKRDRLSGNDQKKLQSLLTSRSPSDSYYLIPYRANDNNVIMRLRAWGPNVEVLYPFDLRAKMRSDLQELSQRYSALH